MATAPTKDLLVVTAMWLFVAAVVGSGSLPGAPKGCWCGAQGMCAFGTLTLQLHFPCDYGPIVLLPVHPSIPPAVFVSHRVPSAAVGDAGENELRPRSGHAGTAAVKWQTGCHG